MGNETSNNFRKFELLFDTIISYCVEFNKTLIPNTFIHIRGGSSTKYYLRKKNINTDNLTKDLDIIIVCDSRKSFEITLQKFLVGLKHNLLGHNVYNDLLEDIVNSIYIDFQIMIEIMYIGDIYDNEMDIYNDIHLHYIRHIDNLRKYIKEYTGSISDLVFIEKITFSPPEIEYACDKKHIEILNDKIKKFLSQVDKLCISKKYVRTLKIQSTIDAGLIYIKQLELECDKNKLIYLKDKLNRYERKLKLLSI